VVASVYSVNRNKVALLVLAVALVGSNAWWAHRLVDAGISLTYLKASFDTANEALNQTLAILPVVATADASRSEVVAAAAKAGSSLASFDKEGYTWVGQLGLKFNEQGRFLLATTAVPKPK
jgi:hypothetical protein